MWSPSGTRAIEPNMRAPTISPIIMAVQSQITSQVLRSLFSCPSPRNTWLWKVGLGALSLIATSLQISANDFEQLLSSFGVQCLRMEFGIDRVHSPMVVDPSGHEPGHRAASASDQVHHLCAARLAI